MKDGLMSIGEVARLKGVGIKALRHYEKIGLLRPHSVDPDTGYRRYSHAQLSDVDAIALCVKLGIPLKDLAQYRLEQGGFDTPRLFEDTLPLAKRRAKEALTALKMIEGGIAYTHGIPFGPEARMFLAAIDPSPVEEGRFDEKRYMDTLTCLMEEAMVKNLIPAPSQGIRFDGEGRASCVLEVWRLEETLLDSCGLSDAPEEHDENAPDPAFLPFEAAVPTVARERFVGRTVQECFERAIRSREDSGNDSPALLLERWGFHDEQGSVAIEHFEI